MPRRVTSARLPAVLALLAVLAASAIAQSSSGPVGQPPATVSVNVPDTMRVSVQGPVNARIGDALTVKVDGGRMPSEPWWASNVVVAFGAAVLGAVVGYASVLAKANLDIGATHRRALARMERLAVAHLNDLISNRNRITDLQGAAEKGELFWSSPHPMIVDPVFTMEVFDLDLAIKVSGLNTDISRYNRNLEARNRAHFGFLEALLAGDLSEAVWLAATRRMAPSWSVVTAHLDAIDKDVREIKARCVLLVRQYDSRKANLRRFFGFGNIRSWPLHPECVEEEIRKYDEERKQELERDREKLARRHGIEDRPDPAARS